MLLEQFPLILAVLFGLLGAALLADAFLDDVTRAPRRERRRRVRAERHRWGEALVGVGMFGCAAALAGRDRWSYGTTAMLVGVLLLIGGAVLNRRLLREAVLHHGAARRQGGGALVTGVMPDEVQPAEESLAETRASEVPPASDLPAGNRPADDDTIGQSEAHLRIR